MPVVRLLKLILLFTIFNHVSFAVTRYVTPAVPGLQNATSWANAAPGTSMQAIINSSVAGDKVVFNDTLSGVINLAPPMSGTYTVGSGGDFPSLTNNAGIFETLNNMGASGNISINIISDLSGETGTHALNELAGGYTVLIRPTGAPRIIAGSINGALIKLNAADNVTIDGSVIGATASSCLVGGDASIRQLTIQNTNIGTAAAVMSIQSGSNGAQNNTIKNLIVLGQNPLTTLVGISIGGNTPFTVGADNDNNRIENCSVQKAINGIYSAGLSIANKNNGNVITQNNLSATTTNRIKRTGIILLFDNNGNVSLNSVGGIDNSGEGNDAIGIAIGALGINSNTILTGNVTNATVDKNKVNGVSNDETFSACGIAVNSGAGGANIISNNMVSGVISDASFFDIVSGIHVNSIAGSETRLYYNSVSMTGDRNALLTPTIGQFPSYAISILGVDRTVELKNNILSNSQVADLALSPNAKSYAIGLSSTTFANLNSNYNNYWSTGTRDGGFRTGSLTNSGFTEYADLPSFAAAVSNDANSQEIDPLFANASNDLHTCALQNLGTPIAGITNDYDCHSRSVTTPAIGADECQLFATLTITAFLEGFYSNINSMRANIFELGISANPTETDTVTVNLWAPSSLSNSEPDHSVRAVIHTDGTATMLFPAAVSSNSFYIAVKHRNHLETWSKLPVMFTSTTSYDFSNSLSQAYDDGTNAPMASVAGGKFAFYGGDSNQDGSIDATDQGEVDNDVALFAFGYNATDATGDGSTDASDMQVVDNNLPLFLFYARPY